VTFVGGFKFGTGSVRHGSTNGGGGGGCGCYEKEEEGEEGDRHG